MRYIIPEEKDEDNYWQITDTLTGEKVLFHISLTQTRDICGLLNRLNDENEKRGILLKRQNVTIQALTENIEKLSDNNRMLKLLHECQDRNKELENRFVKG